MVRTQTLYEPSTEHDSCGFGFVADIAGRPSHAIVRDALTDAGLSVEGADPVVWVGPRRFSVLIEALGARPAVEETLSGPPVKIAFEGGDPTAAPTKAGEGFARKSGVDPSQLKVDEAKGLTYVERSVPRNVCPTSRTARSSRSHAATAGGSASRTSTANIDIPALAKVDARNPAGDGPSSSTRQRNRSPEKSKV